MNESKYLIMSWIIINSFEWCGTTTIVKLGYLGVCYLITIQINYQNCLFLNHGINAASDEKGSSLEPIIYKDD
jgi:hypothetical protein